MADRVTVVGTGAMGAPIARNLLEAGFDVAVWNRSRAGSAPPVALGDSIAGLLTEAIDAGHAEHDCASLADTQRRRTVSPAS